MLAWRFSSLLTVFEENGSLAHGLTGSGVILKRLAGLYHFDVLCGRSFSVRVSDEETDVLRVVGAAVLDLRDVWRKLSWYLDVIWCLRCEVKLAVFSQQRASSE